MKKHRKPVRNQDKEEGGTFFIRCAAAAAALLLVWCVKVLRPETAEAIGRSVDRGLTYTRVIELFGRSVSSRDALHTLWQEGVAEVWEEFRP